MRGNYKNLIVRQKSIGLVKSIYILSTSFPEEEKYWLTSQIRRSAISIPSNIAEWNQRGSQKDFRSFVYIALGSLVELETQIIIAQELWYNKDNDLFVEIEKIILEVRMLLQWLHRKLSEL